LGFKGFAVSRLCLSLYMHPIISRPLTLIKRLFRFLLGELSWSPPKWLILVLLALTWPLRIVWRKYWALRLNSPASFKKLTSVLAVLLVGAVAGGVYYRSLPEPHRLTYSLDLPAPTVLEVTAERPVPIPNPLVISFSGSAAPITLVGKVIQKGITVTPPVEGEWTWTEDNRLRFQPKNDWLVGNKYKGRFEKGSLKPGVLLSSNDFEFLSPEFTPSMSTGEFYEDPTDPKIKQTVFTVKFTHPVNKTEFERNAKLLMRIEPIKSFDEHGVKKVPFKVNYNQLGTVAYLRSDPITIPPKDGEVLATLEAGVHSANGGAPSANKVQYTVRVPGIENYFKITSASHSVVTNAKTYEAEKILTVESTAGVSDSELKKGIEVYLLPSDPKYYEGITKQEDDAEVAEEGGGECDEGSCASEEGEAEVAAKAPNTCPLSSVGQVTEELLKHSKKLSVETIPSEHEAEKLHNFKYESPDASCLFVKVKKGTKAVGDFALATNSSFLVSSGPYPPDVQFMHQGALLSITGEKKLSIVSMNIGETLSNFESGSLLFSGLRTLSSLIRNKSRGSKNARAGKFCAPAVPTSSAERLFLLRAENASDRSEN